MVKEVSWPQLKTYERKPYFWTDGTSTGVFFRADVDGATTPNSSNPRSELRQMYANGDPAAWSNKTQQWSMEALMAFTHLPGVKPHVVGMQIHDGNDDVCVLRLEGNDLYVTQGDDTHYDLIDGSYTLGTFIRVKVVAAKGGGIRWYLNGTLVSTPVSGTIRGAYFKAGCYTQANESNGTGYGETCFKELKVWKS